MNKIGKYPVIVDDSVAETTTVLVVSYNQVGIMDDEMDVINFKDVSDPSCLPDVALCEETVKQWERYHILRIKGLAGKARRKIHKRSCAKCRALPY